LKQITDKDVAIIILNWNAYDDTFECLKSLEHLTYPYFHVFLVDNASQDNSFDKLQEDYKEGKFNVPITFIQTGANLGFAGGNNVAIKEAYNQGYQYFWLLNNDTVVDPNALTPLVDSIKKDPTIGIAGSKIYYYGTNKIWFAGGIVNKLTGNTKHIGMKDIDSEKYSSVLDVDYVTGCSLFFRKEILDTVGYMVEDYFLYYEETDWNLRASQMGWKIKYIPTSVVYHKVSSSSGGESNISPAVNYYLIRNAIAMIKRTQPSYYITIAVIYSLWNVFKNILKIFLYRQDNKLVRIKLGFTAVFDGVFGKMGKL